MLGYGCYHSLPARQRYVVTDELWNTDAELKPIYTLTPLETDTVTSLRLHVRSLSPNIAVLALFDPEKHQYTSVGDEVCYCVVFKFVLYLILLSKLFLFTFVLHFLLV